MSIYKKWSRIVVWSILVLVGTVVFLNAFIDANGIFRKDLSRHFQPPNMSYAKMRYLLQNKHKFDSFLFGSSRAGSIDVKKISGTYYNMFYPGGLPEEHLQNIQFLLKNGVPIKNIMISLDDFSYSADPRPHLSELDLQPHPGVSGKSMQAFYGEYLFKLNKLLPQLKAYLQHARKKREKPETIRIMYDIADSGRVLCRDCDERIDRDVNAHIKDPKFFQPWDYRTVLEDRIGPTLDALRAISELAKKRDIKLIVFINPIHKATYLNTDHALFARFKKELALVTDYYDFSGLNSITTNNYYYYETSHYRPLVGDMMLSLMVRTPDVAVPQNFGVLVTSGSIDAHLRKQCADIVAAGTPLNPANASFSEACQKTGNNVHSAFSSER